MPTEYAKGRVQKLKKRYGLTLDQYDQLLESQAGVCAICHNKDETELLSIDHCHSSNEIRGLLCGKCNRGLGNFGDDVSLLLNAVNYLHNRQKT